MNMQVLAGRYRCLLDEQPLYLVPPRLLSRDVSAATMVNPGCCFSWRGQAPGGPLPPALAADAFMPSDYIVWAPDRATLVTWPYWIGADLLPFVERLEPGRPAPRDLPERVRWILALADILVPPEQGVGGRGEWLHYLPYRAGSFREGFVVIPHLIPPFHLGALRLYYRRKVRAGSFVFGDGQVARRYAGHNEPLAAFVQAQLAGVMAEVAAMAIKPSYAYFVAYQDGASLARHTDREQCEYSVTLLVDATPEPIEQVPWPIKLRKLRREFGIWQYLGESLLYRGRALEHSRDPLPGGHTSTSLLLHYVDQDFAGSLR